MFYEEEHNSEDEEDEELTLKNIKAKSTKIEVTNAEENLFEDLPMNE